MKRLAVLAGLALALTACDTMERLPPGKRPPCNREAPPHGCFQVIPLGSSLHSSSDLLITVEGSTPDLPAPRSPLISEQAQADFESAGHFLRENPEARATIDGHSNALGSEDSEKQRSDQATDLARTSLVKQGIDPKRIKARSYGAEMPMLADPRNEANWRVEIFYPRD